MLNWSMAPAILRGNQPRVAIIHYWLVTMRGGERVLERLLSLFPDADIFTHVYDPSQVSDLIRSHRVQTTFINKLPMARQKYRRYLPLMQFALEELDLTGYDLVISSESGPAKGVLAPPDAFHICYCHSPMRYAWDHYHRYRESSGRIGRVAMAPLLHRVRNWDTTTAQRVDHFVANSRFIQSRIRRAWGRGSDVIHPPVSTHLFKPSRSIRNEFLWVGQMTAYKRPDLVVDAFNKLKLPLVMVGDGEMLESLQKMAGPTIRFLPPLNFAALRRAYSECRALIFAAEEDFGIVPVEANASGRPVIGYGRGGLVDTIVPEETGLFFHQQTTESLMTAVLQFDRWERDFEPAVAIRNAQRFSPAIFDRAFMGTISAHRPDLVPAPIVPEPEPVFAQPMYA